MKKSIKPPPFLPNHREPLTTFFFEAFDYTLKNEGEFSNHPADHGGPTRWGIIQSEYSKYIGHPASIGEMKNLPVEHAKDIYRKNYWVPLSLDKIESIEIAIAIFDRAVLNGLTGCSRLVRQALGELENGQANFDSQIDIINMTAPTAFVMRLADACEYQHRARVSAHPDQRVFLKGWLNRVNRMRRELGDGTEGSVEG